METHDKPNQKQEAELQETYIALQRTVNGLERRLETEERERRQRHNALLDIAELCTYGHYVADSEGRQVNARKGKKSAWLYEGKAIAYRTVHHRLLDSMSMKPEDLGQALAQRMLEKYPPATQK
mgnify:CR=1 FL=1